MKDPIYKKVLASAELIAASGTFPSANVEIGPKIDKDPNVGRLGNFSLELKLSGNAGVLKAEVKCSGNGVDYITVSPEIETGMSVAAGPYYLVEFAMPLCTDFTILLTETGGAANVTVDEMSIISR